MIGQFFFPFLEICPFPPIIFLLLPLIFHLHQLLMPNCLNCGSSDSSRWREATDEMCAFFSVRKTRDTKFFCQKCFSSWYMAKNQVVPFSLFLLVTE